MQFHIPLPFTDDVLFLTPRWTELRQPLQALVLILVCLVPVALVLLYRYELRLIRRPVAVALLALRLLVLFVLLFVAFMQPIMARSFHEDLPGRVVIAIDRSGSMDVTDPQRPAVDKLRLARALKLAGDLCLDAQLDAWIRQYDEKGRAEWVADGDAPEDPARRRQLQEDRRLHDLVCQRVDALTRAQLSQKVLGPEGAGLLPALAEKHQVDLLGFAREAWELTPDQVLSQGADAPRSVERRPVEPAAGDGRKDMAPAITASVFTNTDLSLPLARALERSGPEQERILGVVVLSDGRHNWGPSPVAKALELAEHKLPIYPIAPGARQAPPDIALAGLKAPPTVFKDVDAQIEARFKVGGLAKQDVAVELQRLGQPALKEIIHHDGTDQYHTVRFQVRLDQVGTQTVTVAAPPVAGEIRTDNNSRPIVINVADDKARVLLLDGEARWEYHYLANALARDRAVTLSSVVFAQPRLGKMAEDELKQFGNPSLGLPPGPDALAGYDCIILGDVAPSDLPMPERVRLEKYVADRGGTLVLVAGKRFLPLAYAGRVRGQGSGVREEKTAPDSDPLLKLLPIQEPRAVRPARGFPITFTHEGQSAPFLQMDSAPDKSQEIWSSLPLHYWGVVGKAKPGATALAYLPAGQASGGRQPPVAGADGNNRGLTPPARLGSEDDKEHALIVRQNYGFGRVLFVGLESTWRWRYKVGDAYHHRFWGQVIRWAATDKPLVTGNDHVRFGTREPVYAQGQEVDLVVRLGEDLPPLPAGALAGARILRSTAAGKEEAVALMPLARVEAQPRVLEGRVRDLPAGQYQIELAIPDLAAKLQGPRGADGQPGKLRATFTVTAGDSDEMIELGTNWPLLEELAAKTGGKVFTPETAGQLVDLLTRQAATRELHAETRLWEWWPTLALFLVLLTAEWVIRKWAGMP
jgi:hypothetical protein